jgi:hypothetical protein
MVRRLAAGAAAPQFAVEEKMRTELQAIADQIQQAMSLLRRHL